MDPKTRLCTRYVYALLTVHSVEIILRMSPPVYKRGRFYVCFFVLVAAAVLALVVVMRLRSRIACLHVYVCCV